MLSMLSASAGFNAPALAGSRSSIQVSMDTNIVECPGPVGKVQAVPNPGSSPEFAELKSLSKQLNPVVGYYDPLSALSPLLPPVPRAAAVAASSPWVAPPHAAAPDSSRQHAPLRRPRDAELLGSGRGRHDRLPARC
jgi:hypothetical protein